jgi:stage III sporulation protein AB
MLLKIFGSCLVIAASSIIGFMFSRDCARRPQDLRMLQGLLQMFENEISFLSNVLIESFEKIYRTNKCEVANIFKDTVNILKSDGGLTAGGAWENSVRRNIRKTALNNEDEEILISFGKILGKSDIEGQIKNIRLTMNQLKIQEQKAEDGRKKNEAMFRNLGILGGLALVIILY